MIKKLKRFAVLKLLWWVFLLMDRGRLREDYCSFLLRHKFDLEGGHQPVIISSETMEETKQKLSEITGDKDWLSQKSKGYYCADIEKGIADANCPHQCNFCRNAVVAFGNL